ncbi:uncharacterized protein TNCV_4282851 [Trichonephila clavipes]|nr:uncharacterized protein TNCV_4282851 [Trichonephila clavipes]
MCLITKDSSVGYIWICRKKRANAHCIKRSAKKNSWFKESKLSMLEMLMTDTWVQKSNRDFLSFELSVLTVTDWMSFFREVCMEISVYKSSMLGGPDVIMEIDESMFG